MSRTIKERSKGVSMPFILFQLLQLMVCFRNFIGERIDKTPRKGELLFSKTIIPTRQDIWGWQSQKGAPQLLNWSASLLRNVQQGAGCLACFAGSVHPLPLLLSMIKSFFIMLSRWWLRVAVSCRWKWFLHNISCWFFFYKQKWKFQASLQDYTPDRIKDCSYFLGSFLPGDHHPEN